MKGRKRLMALVAAAAVLMFATGGRAEVLFHETFDYAVGSSLTDAADWSGTVPAANAGIAADSLSMTGLVGTGGHLSWVAHDGDNSARLWPAGAVVPVSGQDVPVYYSFLFRPGTDIGTAYFFAQETEGSANSSIGRLGGWTDATPNWQLIVLWRVGDSGVGAPTTPAPGETYFIVLKATMVDGASNDTMELWINPPVGGAEPTPADATATSTTAGNDIGATGVRGVQFRGNSGAGTFEMDELRAGTTWADVTSALGGAEGEGEGEGEGGPPITEGMPVAGMLGLGLIAAACALGGATVLRNRG